MVKGYGRAATRGICRGRMIEWVESGSSSTMAGKSIAWPDLVVSMVMVSVVAIDCVTGKHGKVSTST